MRRGTLPYSAAFDAAPLESVSSATRIAAIIFRSLFIIALVAVTAWVSRPQFASNWLDHFTFGDFVRVALGFAACVWMVFHLFQLPKDARAYVTWTYLGLALTPLVVLAVIVFW
jgi:hypothetical protein